MYEIYIDIMTDQPKPIEEEIQELRRRTEQIEADLARCMPSVKQIRHRISDILCKANKGKTKPKESTMMKYNIIYDESIKLYVIDTSK